MSEDLQDPRLTLLSNIDFDKCRVEFSDTPIVLLCGGFVPPPKAHPNLPDPDIKSLRDAICRNYPPYEIFRPEEITSWQTDGIFKDLMTFETDLASICTLVVIILESEGSLVELGAFSQLPELSKKIIAIKSTDFNHDNSFINLGILRYIKVHNKKAVKIYPWTINKPQTITQETVNDVISDIQEYLKQLDSSNVLETTKLSHGIVLICEIINYFVLLKESEILKFLLDFFYIKIGSEELKRKLFLLEEFKIIKKVEYSDATFFMRTEEKYHKLRLSLKSEKTFDILRIREECRKYYSENQKYKNWIRAIKFSEQGLKK